MSTKAKVNSHHTSYDNMATTWQRCRDAAAGQRAVHAAGERYLPKLVDQTKEEYEAYKLRASFYNATWRTIDGMRGMVLRRDPQMTLGESSKELLENDADNAGTPFSLMLRNIVRDVLEVGRVGVLVDYTNVPASATLAEAQAVGARPMMLMYATEDIINWHVGSVNNRRKLLFVVLCEKDVQYDRFERIEEKRYRVLELVQGVYQQRVFRINKEGEEEQVGSTVVPQMNGKPLDFIPFFICGTDPANVSFDPEEPPLIDLVDINLSHYRVTADYEHGCHFSALPTPYVSGYSSVVMPNGEDGKAAANDKLYIGSQSAWLFSDPNAKPGYLEFTGAGLEAVAKNLEKKELQMAIIGARMLETPKRGAEAAQTESIRRGGEMSVLQAISVSISHTLTQAVRVFCKWMGETKEDQTVHLNKHFFPMPIEPQALTALVDSWQKGAISKQTLFNNMQDSEIIEADVTYEEEEARIESEGPKPGAMGSLLGTLGAAFGKPADESDSDSGDPAAGGAGDAAA